MNTSRFPAIAPNVDLGQLFLRLGGSFLLFHVHGLPKVVHNNKKLLRIEDPLHFGGQATVLAAIFAEVLCPLLIAAGRLTRPAALPVIFLLLISMIVAHPEKAS